MAFNISQQIDVKSKNANIDFLYGPYESLYDACIAVPKNRRVLGKTVGIIENGSIIEYWWESGIEDTNLVEKNNSGVFGTQLYTQEKYDELVNSGKSIPDHIIYSDGGELNKIPETFTYTTSGNDSYLDIMFSAIRSLQAEVAKMRNAFRYGMYSYVGKDTAMSSVMNVYNNDDENEPLWAVDESDLSRIINADLYLDSNHNLTPQENVVVGDNSLIINRNGASWVDYNGSILNTTDPKLFLFLTTSGTNIQIILNNLNDKNDKLTINFNGLNISKSISDKYNILFVLSRTVSESDVYYGKNFIWMSIGDYLSGDSKISGYFNITNNKIQTRYVGIGEDNQESLSNNRYTISEVRFDDLTIYKFNVYSKLQDFSNSINPSTPTDTDYKYRVAHITIRSVATKNELDSIANQLPTNELIYNEEKNILYIKTENGIKAISGGSDIINNNDMEKSEIIEWLAANGIIVTSDGLDNIKINNIADITFIHQGTGKVFKFETDSTGNLRGTEVSDISLSDRVRGVDFEIDDNSITYSNIRGFVGTLGYEEQLSEFGTSALKKTDNIRLYSDRVKIGAIYAPKVGQSVFGCSHAYIELENTSDCDFPLDGCYLHFATGTCTNESTGVDVIEEYSLALSGSIPAGGTYLIRGKQYSDFEQANTFIKVRTFDQEWYIGNTGELIDFTLHQNNSWIITYGLPGKDIDPTSNFSYGTSMVQINSDTSTKSKAKWVYSPRYIDGVSIGEHIKSKGGNTWLESSMLKFTTQTRDCVYKNTYELDPANQAYQSCNTYDSSRYRNGTATDYQYLIIDTPVIEFPKTDETMPVDIYTPKASFEHKNVSTDKTKLNTEKPNMVSTSFGVNIHTTRCFNWISCGLFDEYVWIRKSGDTNWMARFESYKSDIENDNYNLSGQDSGMRKNTIYKERTIEDLSTGENITIQSVIYNRITNIFPGHMTQYTSHKCIVNIVPSPLSSPTKYEYVVGRSNKYGQPDLNHTSDIQYFTLYPTSYTPRIFQTTDQQGFQWIEYQVWNAAAHKLNETIVSETESENIIPILINTGDMTQNGTRINEWYDYYTAGHCLFNHLEQMNVVGNNDLCGTDPTILGTGDDDGKSNGYYFHVFYCYEIDLETFVPIITNSNATHYIPSFYYFENTSSNNVSSYKFVMLNTEITYVNCRDWYKQLSSSGDVINVYTGWSVPSSSETTTNVYDNSFTTVYSMVYNILSSGKLRNQKIITACHEMPFTVITNANIQYMTNGEYNANVPKTDRSLNGKSTGALVGCHCNRLNYLDTKGIYWLSRLLEHFGVKLCIGGHKHTYACTWPLREFYYYINDSGSLVSSIDGPMEMKPTLEDDTAEFYVNVSGVNSGTDLIYTINNSGDLQINTTKFPLMRSDNTGIVLSSGNTFLPYYGLLELNGGVTYFMCQATGYKLKSNKELPSPDQRFAYVIPKTTVGASSDTPNGNQQNPMFAEIELSGDNYIIYLYRLMNILNSKYKFDQLTYGTGDVSYNFLKGQEVSGNEAKIYGNWNYTTKIPLIEL